MLKSYKSILSVLVIGAAVTGYALSTQAATNPVSAGATSTGDFETQVEVAAKVRVSGLNDVNLGTPVPNAQGQMPTAGKFEHFCVYSNTNAGKYTITMTTTSGNYDLYNANNDSLPLEINHSDYQGWSSPSHGEKSSIRQGNKNSLTCNNANNAQFQLIIRGTNMQTLPPGVYSNTITVLIEPIV
ncbi:MAG: hypothetical protein ACTSXQ_01395 [Alphaproteobacteria bacterium]